MFMAAALFLFFGSETEDSAIIGVICAIAGFGYLFIQRTAENEGEKVADKLNKRASAMQEFERRYAQEKKSKDKKQEEKYEEWFRKRFNK